MVTSGPSISTRTSFTSVPSLHRERADRGRRRQHLRHGIDGQPGEHAVLQLGHVQQRDGERQQQHDADTQARR